MEDPVRLDERFDVLRGVIRGYRDRIQRMERQVVSLFAADQLSAISETIREKQRMERLIQKLEQFVAVWEPLSREQGADRLEANTSQSENLNVPGPLRYK